MQPTCGLEGVCQWSPCLASRWSLAFWRERNLLPSGLMKKVMVGWGAVASLAWIVLQPLSRRVEGSREVVEEVEEVEVKEVVEEVKEVILGWSTGID